MNTFILNGSNQENRHKYIQDLLAKNQLELIHLFPEKSTITIKQIKDMTTNLSIDARIPRLIWIEQANLLTIPAQNALLKTLEEPPQNTSFYLSCHTTSMLLPTIRSRCQTISLPSQLEASHNHLPGLKEIMAQSPGDRLANIAKRDRAESILWFTQIEAELKAQLYRSDLSNSNISTLNKIAKLALQAHNELLSNCSVSLVTQNFYLTLPHTRSTS